MIIAGTGHRPQNCEIGNVKAFSEIQTAIMTDIAKWALSTLGAKHVITGGALGWDTALARAAYSLQIPYRVYVPFKGQESKWTAEQQTKYRAMLKHAARVEVLSEDGYSAVLMQRRNQAMVNDSELLLALWNGKREGGTWNCIHYAENMNCVIQNVWQQYVEMCEAE